MIAFRLSSAADFFKSGKPDIEPSTLPKKTLISHWDLQSAIIPYGSSPNLLMVLMMII